MLKGGSTRLRGSLKKIKNADLALVPRGGAQRLVQHHLEARKKGTCGKIDEGEGECTEMLERIATRGKILRGLFAFF
jgi:hypothetical protein